jgi:hypothetical protein
MLNGGTALAARPFHLVLGGNDGERFITDNRRHSTQSAILEDLGPGPAVV